jgi:hypothetical protein
MKQDIIIDGKKIGITEPAPEGCGLAYVAEIGGHHAGKAADTPFECAFGATRADAINAAANRMIDSANRAIEFASKISFLGIA